MRVVIQRVNEASVTIENHVKAKISKGLLILVGVEDTDTEDDILWLSGKITKMRIFADENGLMNKSVLDEDGEI
jgi:D-tyrosyl-tRNA(Tyr) deacylase